MLRTIATNLRSIPNYPAMRRRVCRTWPEPDVGASQRLCDHLLISNLLTKDAKPTCHFAPDGSARQSRAAHLGSVGRRLVCVLMANLDAGAWTTRTPACQVSTPGDAELDIRLRISRIGKALIHGPDQLRPCQTLVKPALPPNW